jgi:hypothetical protein
MKIDPKDFRMERIEKLLYELQYEITRGVVQNEIEEAIQFTFIIPMSHAIPNGVVKCDFRAQPMRREALYGDLYTPKFRLVKK